MIPLCNGFYLFPLSRAVNSNSLIFDPSEFKIGLYLDIDYNISIFEVEFGLFCKFLRKILKFNNYIFRKRKL